MRSVLASIETFSPKAVKERLPLLCDNKFLLRTPSKLAKTSPVDLYNDDLHHLINYNCPRETESISLTLLSEVFGQFTDDCTREPDSDMCQVLATYARAAIVMSDDLSAPRDENTLMPILTKAFEALYGVTLEHDGHLVLKGRLIMIRELRPRSPSGESGDPLVQGAAYYRCYYVDHLRELERLPEGDVLPALLITYQGMQQSKSLFTATPHTRNRTTHQRLWHCLRRKRTSSVRVPHIC